MFVQKVLDKVNDIFEKFGRIDILVYAAGIFTYSLIKNKFFEDWRKMIDTNCQVRFKNI